LTARRIGGENTSVGDLNWPFHKARLTELLDFKKSRCRGRTKLGKAQVPIQIA
jgi:hypothetical protein